MQTFTYTVKDAHGIHARPAGMLVKEIKKYESSVTIAKDDKCVEGRKLMALMGMAVKCGETVTVAVEGPDEDTAAISLKSFFSAHL